MNDELLPCPFCGGEVTISEGSYDYDGGDRFLYYSADVVCCKCDLTMHVSNNSHEHVPLKHALDFAAKAWNKRVKRSCYNTFENRWFRCSACGFGFTDWYLDDESDIDEQPRYCPNCGARVIHEDVKLVDGTAKIVGYQDGYVIVVDE